METVSAEGISMDGVREQVIVGDGITIIRKKKVIHYSYPTVSLWESLKKVILVPFL